MSLLIGISNEHEFYSQHFLDEQLTNTIAEKVKAETQREKASADACKASPDTTSDADRYRAPWNRLDGSAREILRLIRDAQKTNDAKERIAAEVIAIRHIADCLGLPVASPYVRQLAETGVRLPMLGEVKTPAGAPYLWILHATALGGTKDTVGSVRAEDDTDPLELCIADEQFKETFEADKRDTCRGFRRVLFIAGRRDNDGSGRHRFLHGQRAGRESKKRQCRREHLRGTRNVHRDFLWE